MTGSEHFWTLRCRKSARRCGAKHISKWKRHKAPQFRSTFRSCDVEKGHAVVARSAFLSQNVQSTPGSDHFWKLRCRKSARRCGAKHISKSKVCQKCKKLRGSEHFWTFRCRLHGRRKGFRTLPKVRKTVL